MGRRILLTTVAAVGWYAAFSMRTSFIRPLCQQLPEQCSPEGLNPVDRLWLVNYHAGADFWSFATQYLAGALAIAIPLVARRRDTGGRPWGDLWILLQATLLNGVLNEGVRLLIQRPRPFVYLDPVGQGGAAAHYTSFYSGHTSFAALAATCAYLSARRHFESAFAKLVVLSMGAALVVSTGAFRVLAGRHFISDTLFGALFGAAIAWAVARVHSARTSSAKDAPNSDASVR